MAFNVSDIVTSNTGVLSLSPSTDIIKSFTFMGESGRGERSQTRCEIHISTNASSAVPIYVDALDQTGRILETRVNANDRLVFGLSGATPAHAVDYLWSSDAPFSVPSTTGMQGRYLALPPHALGLGGGGYTLWLHARDTSSAVIYAGCWIAQVNAPPHGGSITVSPLSGIAGVTRFTILAAGWSDEADDLPLSYV